MFLSNWLVFKIVLAAVTGLVDYPLAADVLLKYDDANKLYLSGGSLEYVSNVVLYKGETSYEMSESLNLDASNEQILLVDDRDTNTQLGYDCAIDGDYIIGGAPQDDEADSAAGAAYIFKRTGTSWKQTAKLIASDAAANDQAAEFVNIFGDYAIIGDQYKNSSVGAAYIFKRDTGAETWTQQAKLTASDAASNDNFGIALSINSDYAIIGSPYDDDTADNSGSVYIFIRSGTDWTQQAKLTASDPASNDEFGLSVDMSGDYTIIGANSGTQRPGSAYIFKRSGTSWTEQDKIQASDGATGDRFGKAVALSGDYAVIGAYNDTSGAGSAYIFKKDTGAETWSQQQKLTASDAASNDYFGYKVDISGDTVIIGAYKADPGSVSNAGAAYIFKRNTGTETWTEVKKLTASTHVTTDGRFGEGIGVSGSTIVVGAAYNDVDGVEHAGALYVYNPQQVTNYYITQPGTYRADLQICGIDYKTNTVEVTGTPSNVELYTEPETDFTASEAVLSITSGVGYHQGGMSDNGEYYFYGSQVYKKDTGSFTYSTYGSALSSTIFNASQSSISNDGNYIVSYRTNSTYQLHILKNNGSTFVNHQIIASPNSSARSSSQPQFIPGPLKHFVWIEKVSGSSNITFHFYKYNSSTDTWSLGFSVTNPTGLSVGDRVYGRGGVSFSENGNYLAISADIANTNNKGVAVLKVDWVNETCVKKYENTSVGYWACFLSRDAKYFYYSTSTGTTAGKMLYSANGDWESTPTDITSSFTNIGNLGDHTSVFSDRYIFSEKGGSAVYIFKWQDLISPTLTFDGYNQLSLTNTPTYMSSKLAYYSNVYDVGTLTNKLYIDKTGEYTSLTFDTSSNVAYFSNATVGAMGTTLADYVVDTTIYGTVQSGQTHQIGQGGFGNNTILNADGTRLLITDPLNYPSGRGRAYIYHLENGSWVLKQTWDNPNNTGQRFADGACMNEDGTRIFLMHNASEKVYTYEYTNGAWPTDNTGTHVITVGTNIGAEYEGLACNKAGDVLLMGHGNANTAYIYRRASATSWSQDSGGSFTKGRGVAMNGDGTRAFIGNSTDGTVHMTEWNGSTWSSLTQIIDESYSNWPCTMMSDSVGETLVIVSGNGDSSSGNSGIYERDSGTGLWSRAQGVNADTEIYGMRLPSISYDGTMVLVGSFRYDSSKGRAQLWQKSNGAWTLKKEYLNPDTSPASSDQFGAGCGIARTTKDKFVIGMEGDDTAGTDYGSLYVYSNEIPKYLDFDTYNKLSIQNITPTATTLKYESNTYDLTTQTDIYIENTGTYDAGIKASDKFALVSNVVSGTIQPYTFMKNVQTIYGASSSEQLGWSDNEGGGTICFNKDGTKLALSSYNAQKVYVYTLTNGTYVLDSGTPLTNSNHFFGYACSLNDDGTLLAVNHFGGSNQQTGDTYVYQYSSGSWSLRATFGGGLYYTKASVLDGVGNRVLASASGTNTMKIYDWNGSTYTETYSFSGSSEFANGMDMTRDGLIVGGINKTTNNTVKVWQYSGSSWSQMGSDVSVGNVSSFFRLNRVGGTRFIVSSPYDDTAFTDAGIVKVYDYTGGSWTNTKTFYGDSASSGLGTSINISDDGKVIISGGSTDDTKSTDAGVFYEFKETNGVWETKKFYDNVAGARFGSGIAMNSTANVYAIGAGYDDTIANNAGKVVIYKPENVFSFDGYNKLSIENITPTASTLRLGSNTYDIGTATDIYIDKAGTYEIETKDANTFALVSNVVDTVTQVVKYDYSQSSSGQQKITASDGSSTEYFGRRCAISGDKMVVTASSYNSHQGAAYIFTKSGTTWSQQQKLTVSGLSSSTEPQFGHGADISGNYVIVGAYEEDTDGTNAGGAYIFNFSGGTWTQQPKIVSSDIAAGDVFGYAVGIDGDYAIVGAQSADLGDLSNAGAAYIFKRSGTSWTQQAKLTASDAADNDAFGRDVAIKGDYAIVGALNADLGDLSNAGAAYIFKKDTGAETWTQKAILTASDAGETDYFGDNVSMSGDYVIVGAKGNDSSKGAAYIFMKDTGAETWTQQAKLIASDAVTQDEFGWSVSIDNDLAIVGSLNDDDGGTSSGSAYVFARDGTNWSQQVKLTASDAASNDNFGNSVAIDGDFVVVGARGDASSTGAAYIYTAENIVPKLTHDGYNKLSIENITPTATTLKYGSNTYDLTTQTDIYIDKAGTYEIETKDANTFALVSNTVSGTIKTVEPVITGGYFFGHALTYDGKLYGWGENSSGELGVGDTTDKTVPTLCTGIPQGEIVSIWNQSIRGQSRWAKTRDGRIWVTGDHDSYCLPGSSSDFTTFTDVSVEFGDYTQTSNNVVWASGSERATQVLMENGDVWSFGDDTGSLGVLGQGASPTSDRTPRKLNVSNITKITYGGDLVLALDSSNVIWMWGRNQVGNSTLGWGPYNVPTNIMSTGTNSLTSLLATDSETVVDIESSYYSMFALTDKGTVYCTGHNASGQLGQGNATAKTSSDGWVKIEYFTSNAITVNKLYVGGGNPHVFADTSDGWYCWGENTTGELGLGDTTDKLSPVKFTGVSNIKKFGVGYLVSYAITEDGKYYAWGNGTTYARGDNTTGDITYPKYIDTLPNILAPSFEFDGYDKVLVNYPEVYKYDFYINVLSDDNLVFHEINFKDSTGASIKPLSYDKYNEIPVASWATGDMSGLFDGSTTSPPDFGFYKSDSSVDDKMFYVILPKLASSVVISHARPKYTPGFKIKVGTSVVFSEDSNGGTGETPAPYSKTCTLSTNVSKSQYTKYTKDTHTYDTNQAQIVTVSDPGTYDAQIKSDIDFSLKSATIPATKASGLYTWAFHHGNFDNAYGDGDILTARDNGRFYADTPSYTGDIGTITAGSSTTSNTTYTFTPASALTANVLMVAGGGGGGGRYNCGGGGAGGLVYTVGTTLSGTKTIVVGNGDSGGNGGAQSGYNGKDTTFTGLTTAVGGGYGGTQGTAGGNGGSGGGGGGQTGNGPGGSATSGQGFAGGTGSNSGSTFGGGGGGGGAGDVGGNGSDGVGGNGGIGKFFGTGSSYTDFGDEYGEGGYFASGAGGGSKGSTAGGIPGRGGGGYGARYYGYMGIGGSQHALPHTGGGGGGGSTPDRDQHPGYASNGDGGVTAHGGRGGSGIVLLQTNVALPNGSNTAVVQVGNPRRRSLPPTVDAMGSEVNRFSIIDSASMPTYKLPTHWYVDPIGSNSNSLYTTQGSHSLQKRADGGTSNVWYATSNHYFAEYGSYMAQTADAVFMPVEQQSYDVLLSIGSNGDNDISFEMNADGTASLRRSVYTTSQVEIAGGSIVCFEAGKWHHIALTVDSGGNAVGYVNGYPVVSGTYTSVAAVGSRSGNMHFRCGVSDVTFRKFLLYEVNTYNFHMSPKQVMQRAAEVGLGPKLEYDGLNAINVVNTEKNSEITIYESNVNDTSNLYVVSCNESSYLLSNAGTYYAQIKGTDTFTITRPLTVTDDHFPLYQYPPVATGTLSNGNFNTAAGSSTSNQSYFTVSGAETGNGTYYSYSSVAAASPGGTPADSSSVFTNGVGIDTITYTNEHYNFFHATSSSNIDLVVVFPSAKTIRKYVLYPADGNVPSPYEPGSSVNPMLEYNGSQDYLRRPKSWTLYGYTESTGWVSLDTVTNQPPSIYGDVHSISSPASYDQYKLSISENNGSTEATLLGEWQLWGDA
jgi:alpha-tubulin suppressor-like RCC1 family protein